MMGDVMDSLALRVTAADLAVATAAWLVTRRHRPAVPLLLDFLLAAGLLRLTADQSWEAIGSTALVVVLRQVASRGIAQGAAGRRTTGASA